METILAPAGLLVAGYLMGSIPWGLLLASRFAGVDVRRQGSGNIGATNVRRLAGNGWAALTLAGDALKGALPVLLAEQLWRAAPSAEALAAAVGLAAFLGHLYPVYLKFKAGGKGVATAAGIFAVLVPLALACLLAVFGLTVLISRRVSLGSVTAAAMLTPAVAFFSESGTLSACALMITGMIGWRHRANFRRLRAGTEDRI
jgi:glycerol-3-phosphate acyltransferase PlsY